jgi:hypothetical protein
MALFKSNPEKALQRDIAAATDARDKLNTRLAEAETAVIDLRIAAERLALDGADDAALTAAEAKTRALIDRTATLKAALTQSEARLAGLERELAELTDKTMRAATAAEVAAMADHLEATATSLGSIVEKMAEITGRAGLFIYEAKGLESYATASKTQVPDAVALIATLLRSHASAVLNGTAPAALPKQPAPEPIVVAPPPANHASPFKYEFVGRGPPYRLPISREAGR